MSRRPEFVLVRLAELRAHEEVDPDKVRQLAEEIVRSGVFEEPIWVARGSNVILNGHHRVAALRSLGAERIAAWYVDYFDDAISLDRWTPGPPVSKEEVVRRARESRLFSPRTTRHALRETPPPRSTPIADLGVGKRAPAQARRSSARRAARSSSPPE